MSLPTTMKAVIIKEPYVLALEERPFPQLKADTDVIIKVSTAGICGSDLHIYRGHQPGPYNFIIGHEAVGTIVKAGDDVKKWKVGDRVIVPFSTSCGKCYYCAKGYTSRCANGDLFGSVKADGMQAEYARVSHADGCLFAAPADIPEKLMVLMADIVPTGYYVATNAKRLADEDRSDQLDKVGKKGGVAVVIGCGPVGLCAISSAVTMFDKVFATDIAEHRLEAAARHGAIALPADKVKAAILEATEGRGADAALEVVGHAAAIDTAVDLVRPYGVISSCGVHTHPVTVPGSALYGKNLRFQYGRCSVQTFIPGAIEILRTNKDLFEHFIENEIGFDEVVEVGLVAGGRANAQSYKLFEKNKIGKTVIVLDK
ncbi:putative zinc-binding alcohol dehydrogenase [Vanrija pseudolonga]|uniref:Zinc-binding alcohol dehydrogenase n=1 Tax=Vanrija pseudolonga TaxID=143232 RepID=A0AAF1BNE5_9TREE|nr:putative zinc-binding alcohol dehydrogenase [Vanrija pseudolonga]